MTDIIEHYEAFLSCTRRVYTSDQFARLEEYIQETKAQRFASLISVRDALYRQLEKERLENQQLKDKLSNE